MGVGMGTKKKSWYAVKKGRKTGLYTTWEECRKQVIGYGGAEYKGFYVKEEADAYLSGKAAEEAERGEAAGMTVYVDGSYVPFLPDRYSFGAVFLSDGGIEKVGRCFIDPVNAEMRNVAGEVAGVRYAMEYCVERNIPSVSIYYDYAGLEKWCTGEWKANKEGTKALKTYYDSIKSRLHVTFHKVKSHTGVRYNEMADRLAKEALMKENI